MYTAGQEAKASGAKLLHYSSAQHSTVQYSEPVQAIGNGTTHEGATRCTGKSRPFCTVVVLYCTSHGSPQSGL